MKKVILSVCAVALILSVIGIYAFGDSFDASAIGVKVASRPTVKADERLELSLNYYILKSDMDYLEANAEDVRVYAITLDYEEGTEAPDGSKGTETDLTYVGEITSGGKKYAAYSLNFGVISYEDYNEKIASRAFLSFKLRGMPYLIASDYSEEYNVFSPYEAVYSVYCDRAPQRSDEYPFKAEDGSYSPIKNLEPLRKVLASYLYVDIANGRVKDKNTNRYYNSLYELDYFDGVLTISMKKSADIPEWLLYKLYVNGEERYFEIHDGKIRLVV